MVSPLASDPIRLRIAVKGATPSERAYLNGVEFLRLNQLTDAESAFRQSNLIDPAIGIGYVGLAEIARLNWQLQQSEAWLRQGLARGHRHAGIHAAWGLFLESRQRWQEAESAYRRSIALDPRAAEIQVSLGDVLLKGLNRPREAAEVYRAALQLDPSLGAGHYALGIALTKLNQRVDAQAAFEKAALLSPDNPVAHHTLGELYLARGNSDAALRAFGAALAANPKFFLAHIARGDILMTRGDGPQAVAEYIAAVAIAPNAPLPKVKAGMANQAQGKAREAREFYLAALKLDPNQVEALNNLAWMAVQSNTELDQALVWSTKAVDLAPQNAALIDTLGWVQYVKGDAAAAVRTLQRAIRTDPAYSGAQYHLGVIFERIGERPKAEAALRKALELSASFDGAADARQRLARYSLPAK